METIEQTPTLSKLWQLLHPSITYDTRGRFHKCESYWYGMDDAQRLRVYRIIESHINNGDGINPNPCYALNDAMQEDEQQQAKLKQLKKKTPTNFNGSTSYDRIIKCERVVSAKYGMVYGVYTLAEAEEFHMEIGYGMNFDYEAYKLSKQ